VRAGRAPVPAYRPGLDTTQRDFVPVEALLEMNDPGKPGGDSEGASGPPPEAAISPAFVSEPDAAWAERATLFGDAEG
jgi:hypothetical protein